jgi:hypothetical protein
MNPMPGAGNCPPASSFSHASSYLGCEMLVLARCLLLVGTFLVGRPRLSCPLSLAGGSFLQTPEQSFFRTSRSLSGLVASFYNMIC